MTGADFSPLFRLADVMHAAWVTFAGKGDHGWPKLLPARNSSQPLDPTKENDLDALKPVAGLLGKF